MKLSASFKTWLAIYPSITAFNYFFGSYLSALPMYQRTFLLTIALVPWVIFIALPFIDALIKKCTPRNKQV